MDSILLHRKCGGKISVDILRAFSWKSPSVVLSPDGVKIGVTEFRGGVSKKGEMVFTCEECGEELARDDFADTLEMECQVCNMKKSVKNMANCRQLQCVCDDCQAVLTGDEEPENQRQKAIVEYIFLGKRGEVIFTPILKILEKSVVFG